MFVFNLMFVSVLLSHINAVYAQCSFGTCTISRRGFGEGTSVPSVAIIIPIVAVAVSIFIVVFIKLVRHGQIQRFNLNYVRSAQAHAAVQQQAQPVSIPMQYAPPSEPPLHHHHHHDHHYYTPPPATPNYDPTNVGAGNPQVPPPSYAV